MPANPTEAQTVEKPDAEQAAAAAAAEEAEAEDLKGKELDAALEAANLPKTGTADEKRARLAAPRPKSATHLNSYGDPVHIRKDLHTFVEARGHTPL